jgi:hypothetical protein
MGKAFLRWAGIGLLISLSLNIIINSTFVLGTTFFVVLAWVIGVYVYKTRTTYKKFVSDRLQYEDFKSVEPVIQKTETVGAHKQVQVHEGGSLTSFEQEQWNTLIGGIDVSEMNEVTKKVEQEKVVHDKNDPYDPPISLTWDTFNIFKRKKKTL